MHWLLKLTGLSFLASMAQTKTPIGTSVQQLPPAIIGKLRPSIVSESGQAQFYQPEPHSFAPYPPFIAEQDTAWLDHVVIKPFKAGQLDFDFDTLKQSVQIALLSLHLPEQIKTELQHGNVEITITDFLQASQIAAKFTIWGSYSPFAKKHILLGVTPELPGYTQSSFITSLRNEFFHLAIHLKNQEVIRWYTSLMQGYTNPMDLSSLPFLDRHGRIDKNAKDNYIDAIKKDLAQFFKLCKNCKTTCGHLSKLQTKTLENYQACAQMQYWPQDTDVERVVTDNKWQRIPGTSEESYFAPGTKTKKYGDLFTIHRLSKGGFYVTQTLRASPGLRKSVAHKNLAILSLIVDHYQNTIFTLGPYAGDEARQYTEFGSFLSELGPDIIQEFFPHFHLHMWNYLGYDFFTLPKQKKSKKNYPKTPPSSQAPAKHFHNPKLR